MIWKGLSEYGNVGNNRSFINFLISWSLTGDLLGGMCLVTLIQPRNGVCVNVKLGPFLISILIEIVKTVVDVNV